MHTADSRTKDLENAVTLYKRLVYGLALNELDTRAEADDVFREVFLLYFRKAPEEGFDSEQGRRSWFVKTTLDYCKWSGSSMRDNRVEKKAPDELAKELFSDDRESSIFIAVKELPEKYRLPVYLYYFENMSAADTAKALELKESNVLSRLTRARKKLKKILEGDIFDEE